jgi:hypothetical protein
MAADSLKAKGVIFTAVYGLTPCVIYRPSISARRNWMCCENIYEILSVDAVGTTGVTE